MKIRAFLAVAASAVLATATLAVPAQGAATPRVAALRTCWNQLQPTMTLGATGSTRYVGDAGESPQAADDFILTSPCTVSEVIASGNTFGTINSVNVTFYAGKYQRPTTVIPGGKYPAQSGFTYDATKSQLIVKLAKPLKLTPATYWVSVQPVEKTGGFLWTNVTQLSGSPAVWRDPDPDFARCKTWEPVQGCIGFGGIDFSFELLGT